MIVGGQKFGEFALGEGRYFCIWRCQNKVEGPRVLENIVEVSLDRFYELGMARFHQYLSIHLNFQLRLLLQALKMGIFG